MLYLFTLLCHLSEGGEVEIIGSKGGTCKIYICWVMSSVPYIYRRTVIVVGYYGDILLFKLYYYYDQIYLELYI